MSEQRKPHQVIAIVGGNHGQNTWLTRHLCESAQQSRCDVAYYQHNSASRLDNLPEHWPVESVLHALIDTPRRRLTLLSFPHSGRPLSGPYPSLSLADAAVLVLPPGIASPGTAPQQLLQLLGGLTRPLIAAVMLSTPQFPANDQLEANVRDMVEDFGFDGNQLLVVRADPDRPLWQLLEAIERSPLPPVAPTQGPGWIELGELTPFRTNFFATYARVRQGAFFEDDTVLLGGRYNDRNVHIQVPERRGTPGGHVFPLTAGELHLLYLKHPGNYFPLGTGMILLSPGFSQRTHTASLDVGWWDDLAPGLVLAKIHGCEIPVAVSRDGHGAAQLSSYSPIHAIPGVPVELWHQGQRFAFGQVSARASEHDRPLTL